MSDPETIKKLDEISDSVKALSGKLDTIIYHLAMIGYHQMSKTYVGAYGGPIENAFMTPKEKECDECKKSG